MKPKVTIIIPVFNAERFVEKYAWQHCINPIKTGFILNVSHKLIKRMEKKRSF